MEKVSKWFDDFQALNDVDLTIYEGERIVICGPSGSGKSTLIRCLNGLEQHQKGKITVHGTELTGDTGSVRTCLLYTSPSPRDRQKSRMPSSA